MFPSAPDCTQTVPGDGGKMALSARQIASMLIRHRFGLR
jgi:hypothetical protein